MLVYTDLHLHSCLSPCADDDMTPWNVVGMAKLKGLDVIAVTDHNAALNLPQAMRAGDAYGIHVIPGLEVTSREEVHMLAYFDSVEAAMAFGEVVDSRLPDIQNNPSLFGRQIIIGEDDQEVGELSKLLIAATDFSVEQLDAVVQEYKGVLIPAHINRTSNGMIGALGLMPSLPAYPVVEVYAHLECPAYATKGRKVLYSSDAHHLDQIQERVFSIEASAPTASAVMEQLRREKYDKEN